MADIEPHLSRVGDKSLRHVLSSGVAFLHATMTAAEKEVVTLLFNTGAIQVCGGDTSMLEGTCLPLQTQQLLG